MSVERRRHLVIVAHTSAMRAHDTRWRMWRGDTRSGRLAVATAGALAFHIALAVATGVFVAPKPPRVPSESTPPPTLRTSTPAPSPTIEVQIMVEGSAPAKPVLPSPPSPRHGAMNAPAREQISAQQPIASDDTAALPPSRPQEPSAPVISDPTLGVGATGTRVPAQPAAAAHGTSSSAGSGAGTAPTGVAVIAAIKTPAMPRGDFAYDVVKDYPQEAKQLGIEGKIRVKLIVDERGNVAAATLLNRLGHGLDEQAVRRAGQLAFEPAKDANDQPVRSIVIWTFDFTLPK